jgi:hypothetical protein
MTRTPFVLEAGHARLLRCHAKAVAQSRSEVKGTETSEAARTCEVLDAACARCVVTRRNTGLDRRAMAMHRHNEFSRRFFAMRLWR